MRAFFYELWWRWHTWRYERLEGIMEYHQNRANHFEDLAGALVCRHAHRMPVGNEGGWRCEDCDYEVDP